MKSGIAPHHHTPPAPTIQQQRRKFYAPGISDYSLPTLSIPLIQPYHKSFITTSLPGQRIRLTGRWYPRNTELWDSNLSEELWFMASGLDFYKLGHRGFLTICHRNLQSESSNFSRENYRPARLSPPGAPVSRLSNFTSSLSSPENWESSLQKSNNSTDFPSIL